jgi:hypothetical protein
MSETTSIPEIPGWYITFQQDVLGQLPRPGEIDQTTADRWHKDREALKKALERALCPSSTKNLVAIVDYGLSKEEIVATMHPIKNATEVLKKLPPIVGEGRWEIEFEIFRNRWPAHSNDVVSDIHSRGHESAKAEDFLAYMLYCCIPTDFFFIVNLGVCAIIEDEPYILEMEVKDGVKKLLWVRRNTTWTGSCRFLTVKSRKRIA